MVAAQLRGRRRDLSVLWSLTGLFTLAVTQPLLDLIGRNAAFLVAHDIGRRALVLLTVGLAFGVPLLAAAIVEVVARVHRPGASLLHAALVAVLTSITLLVVLRVGGVGAALPGAVELTIAAVVGALAGVAYRRAWLVRRLLDWSALAAPAVVVLFLLGSPARAILLPTADGDQAVRISGPAPDIVVVIFDELPLASLLDEQLEVDRDAFPAFGGLAEDSTFFRNVTASHSSTVEAIPSLLSGRYSVVNSLPSAAAHPTNIFSLLENSHTPHAFEPLTSLCVAERCGQRGSGDRGVEWPTFLRDVGVLQRHLVTPDDLASGLPPLDAAWRDFDAAGEELDRDKFLGDAMKLLREDTPADFRRFTRRIKAGPRPQLHVLHTLLPHRPWRYLPDGRRHGGTAKASFSSGTWVSDEWAVTQGHQLHLAQLAFADRLLGELVDKLKDEELYDDALVVVAADHGVSLTPGTPPRAITRGSLPDILPVPLFVKAPGQQTPEVSDAAFETVDVLPTMLDVLDATPPTQLDGRSALSAPARTSRRIIDSEDKVWPVDASQDALLAGIERKVRRFGAAPLDIFRTAPGGQRHLYGRRLPPDLPNADDGATAKLANRAAYRDVPIDGDVVRTLVSGSIRGMSSEPSRVVAVAVNGTIEAVTLMDSAPAGNRGFRALVRPQAFRPGRNQVEVVHVDRSGGLRRLPPPP